MNSRKLALMMTLALFSSACWFKKQNPPAPPPPAPQPAALSKEPPAIEEPVLKQQPQQHLPPRVPLTQPMPSTQPAPAQQGPVVHLPDPRADASPRPAPAKKRSASRNPSPKTGDVEPPPPIVGPPPPPLPQLSVLLSPEERQSLEQEYARRLKSVKALVIVISNRKLDAAQKDSLQRIESFLAQAQEQVKRDLSTAVQFARRAELLAQELYNALP